MLSAMDVANFFIDFEDTETSDGMTNLRVNKLLYFAQGWSLVCLKRGLFQDSIKAWKLGPVVEQVYQTFKPCGKNRIDSILGDYSYEKFSDEELQLLIDIQREYGKYSTSALVDMTHEPSGPWSKYYVQDGNQTIPENEIETYFAALPPIKHFNKNSLKEIETVGQRDESGYLVLPKEYDSGL